MANVHRREVILLNCDEIRLPLVLEYVYREFTETFTRAGHTVRTVTNISDLPNTDALIFMGDTFASATGTDGMARVCQRLYTQAPNATFVGWYWQDHCAAIDAGGAVLTEGGAGLTEGGAGLTEGGAVLTEGGAVLTEGGAVLKFLHIHENMLHPQVAIAPHMVRMLANVPAACRCPLFLRANDAVARIGHYARRPERDYCYMGWRYEECDKLVPRSTLTGIYHAVNDHTQYLTYDQRRELYLTSHFALGFQGGENIENGHVSQRIFEGLAYGCIVLTNSWPACEQTNRIAEYVSCRADVETKMRYFLDHPDLMARKQQAGYAFVRQQGTNDYVRMRLLHAENKMRQYREDHSTATTININV